MACHLTPPRLLPSILEAIRRLDQNGCRSTDERYPLFFLLKAIDKLQCRFGGIEGSSASQAAGEDKNVREVGLNV